MRIAVLVKQVPKGEAHTLVDGRLTREGVELEVNAYCRRANAKAVELAGADGEVVTFTMGPPMADEALREMIACGATRGVHLCDPMFAGSDTLATARALCAAIVAEGTFDLVLCGLNSLDADTGQVGPELAELLGLPFVGGARNLDVVDGHKVDVRSEIDSGYQRVRVELPAVISTAERLCDPSKADVDRRREVDPGLIRLRSARDLGLGPDDVGATGSPTSVGSPEDHGTFRAGEICEDTAAAVRMLRERGAFDRPDLGAQPSVPAPVDGETQIWVVLDPYSDRSRRELLGEAATIAADIGGSVTAVVMNQPDPDLGAEGADEVLVVPGVHVDDWSDGVANAVGVHLPRILLIEGTQTGRAVGAKVAARHGWGLTGDGIRIDADPSGAMTVWKSALGGQLVVPILSDSPVQVATIRPGVLGVRNRRPVRTPPVSVWSGQAGVARRVEVIDTEFIDEGRAELAGAEVVIGVGQGVAPDDYERLEPLRAVLHASLGATRKVTDQGWMPRSRQIGITGLSLAPRLFVSLGASGRFNHVVGFNAADHVLAINLDPGAEIFSVADVGIVGDWRTLSAELVEALTES